VQHIFISPQKVATVHSKQQNRVRKKKRKKHCFAPVNNDDLQFIEWFVCAYHHYNVAIFTVRVL